MQCVAGGGDKSWQGTTKTRRDGDKRQTRRQRRELGQEGGGRVNKHSRHALRARVGAGPLRTEQPRARTTRHCNRGAPKQTSTRAAPRLAKQSENRAPQATRDRAREEGEASATTLHIHARARENAVQKRVASHALRHAFHGEQQQQQRHSTEAPPGPPTRRAKHTRTHTPPSAVSQAAMNHPRTPHTQLVRRPLKRKGPAGVQ